MEVIVEEDEDNAINSIQPALGQLEIARPKPPPRRRPKKRIQDLDQTGGIMTI